MKLFFRRVHDRKRFLFGFVFFRPCKPQASFMKQAQLFAYLGKP